MIVSSAEAASSRLAGLQRKIVEALQGCDQPFANHRWVKGPDEPLQGEGVTSILEGGPVFERAGVGFSRVSGSKLPPSASANRPELSGRAFEACGVSLVIHPRNPFVPTVHANVRVFTATAPDRPPVWWIGGGMDLTPYYPDETSARHFHQMCKTSLDPFGAELYEQFKLRCDQYFFLKHRGETRGVGGIFFDDFQCHDFDESLQLLEAVGNGLLKAYLPIVAGHKDDPYDDSHRRWQALRRGRYVEFNLVYDRGTLFGLQSGGRTESILLSMPPTAAWSYEAVPPEGTPEAILCRDFLRPRDWLNANA